jgi:cytochrome P450
MSTRPPVTDWFTDFDHRDPQWVEDPYPIWDEIRSECPVAHTNRFQGVYFAAPYEDVRAIAHDTEHFSSRRIHVRENLPPPTSAPPITSDPPDHRPASSCCCRHLRLRVSTSPLVKVIRCRPEDRSCTEATETAPLHLTNPT